MKRCSLFMFLLLFISLQRAGAARADEFKDLDMEYEAVDVHPGQITVENANWQVGLGGGYAYVLNPPTIHQTTTNAFSVFGLSDDEVVVGTSGKLHNSADIVLNVYRHLKTHWWAGVETDYQVSHKVDAVMDNDPLFSSVLQIFGFKTVVTSHETIGEVIPCLKYSTGGPGRTRFYIAAGGGWASVQLSNTIHYIFTSGNLTADLNADQDSWKSYFAAKAGAGMDYALSEDGSVGVDLRYNAILMPHGPLQMVIPTLHFDYHF